MLNIEKYKGEIECCYDNERANKYSKPYCLSKAIKEVYIDRCKDKSIPVLEWLCEEYKEPILDETERKYLSAVVKPFRNRTEVIAKLLDCGEKREYIAVGCNTIQDSFSLPSFEKGTMYKCMELNKQYTLEELGITYDD